MRRSDRPSRLAAYLSRQDVGCPRCGYNLRGLRASSCPECGASFDEQTVRIVAARRGLAQRASDGCLEWSSDAGLVANLIIGLGVLMTLGVLLSHQDAVSPAGIGLFLASCFVWLAANGVWAFQLEASDHVRFTGLAAWLCLSTSVAIGVVAMLV